MPIDAPSSNDDPDWIAFANTHRLAAVELSKAQIGDNPLLRWPSFVYTWDVVIQAPGARGVIIDCMMPRSNGTLPRIF